MRNLHRLKLLQTGFLCDFVLALVGIVLKVAHIGNVAHVAHLVAQMQQIAIENIERYGRPSVPQVGIAINRWPADVHSNPALVYRLEWLFCTR